MIHTETIVNEFGHMVVKVVRSIVRDDLASKRNKLRGKVGGDTIMEMEMPESMLTARSPTYVYTVTIMDSKSASECTFTLDQESFCALTQSFARSAPQPGPFGGLTF